MYSLGCNFPNAPVNRNLPVVSQHRPFIALVTLALSILCRIGRRAVCSPFFLFNNSHFLQHSVPTSPNFMAYRHNSLNNPTQQLLLVEPPPIFVWRFCHLSQDSRLILPLHPFSPAIRPSSTPLPLHTESTPPP